jgi:hypothetical protein
MCVAKEELDELLNHPDVAASDCPILVFANKVTAYHMYSNATRTQLHRLYSSQVNDYLLLLEVKHDNETCSLSVCNRGSLQRATCAVNYVETLVLHMS